MTCHLPFVEDPQCPLCNFQHAELNVSFTKHFGDSTSDTLECFYRRVSGPVIQRAHSVAPPITSPPRFSEERITVRVLTHKHLTEMLWQWMMYYAIYLLMLFSVLIMNLRVTGHSLKQQLFDALFWLSNDKLRCGSTRASRETNEKQKNICVGTNLTSDIILMKMKLTIQLKKHNLLLT